MKKHNNKGFTLVELVVVIAIIGVLAAILVPTLIGYTTQSKVTSANSTAANVRKLISNYLTEADAHEYGMKVSDNCVATGQIVITGGNWVLTLDDATVFNNNGSGLTWSGSGAGKAGDDRSGVDSADDELTIMLASAMPEIEDGFIKFYLVGGSCRSLYMTTESNADVTMPVFGSKNWEDAVYVWSDDVAGICTEGFVVGTSPQLTLGNVEEE